MCLEHWPRCSLTIYRLIYELNHECHDEIKREQLDIPFSESFLQFTKVFLRPENSREFGKQVGLWLFLPMCMVYQTLEETHQGHEHRTQVCAVRALLHYVDANISPTITG